MPVNAPDKMLGSNHIYQGTCRKLGLPLQDQAIRIKVDASEHLF